MRNVKITDVWVAKLGAGENFGLVSQILHVNEDRHING
jgi:hypothetical protein